MTNPEGNVAKVFGLDLTMETRTRRLFLLAGGTAGYFEGVPANRGFQLTENDRGLIGETFANPTARTYSTKTRPCHDPGDTPQMSDVYTWRQITAVRPPRALRAGVRVTF